MPYKDPAKKAQQSKEWLQNNPEWVKEYNKEYKKKNPDYMRDWSLKTKYGMTSKDWDDMYSNQDGKCKICLNNIIYRGRQTHVDHCHTTGKVRGLLCSKCNQMIGLANEDKDILQKAIDYLTDSSISR